MRVAEVYVGVLIGDGKAPKEYAKAAKDALGSAATAIIGKDSDLTGTAGDGYVIPLRMLALTVAGSKITGKIDCTIETTKRPLSSP